MTKRQQRRFRVRSNRALRYFKHCGNVPPGEWLDLKALYASTYCDPIMKRFAKSWGRATML